MAMSAPCAARSSGYRGQTSSAAQRLSVYGRSGGVWVAARFVPIHTTCCTTLCRTCCRAAVATERALRWYRSQPGPWRPLVPVPGAGARHGNDETGDDIQTHWLPFPHSPSFAPDSPSPETFLLIHRRRRRRGLHRRAPHRIRTGPHRVVHRFLIPLALMLNCWLSRPGWTGFLGGCSTKGPYMSRFSPSSFPVHFPSIYARLLAILTRAGLETKKWQYPVRTARIDTCPWRASLCITSPYFAIRRLPTELI